MWNVRVVEVAIPVVTTLDLVRVREIHVSSNESNEHIYESFESIVPVDFLFFRSITIHIIYMIVGRPLM